MKTSIISNLTLTEYQALVTGIPKFCPTAIFTVAGQTFTAPQAVTFVASVLAAVSAVATAKTGWKDARLAEEKIVVQDGAAVKAIRDNVALMFSNNTTTLAEFAIVPKKPRVPLSLQARAAATEKARATRLARGTESKKKKAAVTGNVTGAIITPVTSTSSTPTSSPSAATSPPVGSSVTTPATSAAPIVPTPASPAAGSGAAPATGSAPTK